MAVVKRQAGCVPLRRRTDGELELLLVTSRYTGQWIAPKGNIDPGERPEQAAAREAAEEAGVLGRVGASLGTHDYPRGHGVGRIQAFVLEVTEELTSYQEQGQRRRRWFSLAQATAAVERAEVLGMLEQLEQIIMHVLPLQEP